MKCTSSEHQDGSREVSPISLSPRAERAEGLPRDDNEKASGLVQPCRTALEDNSRILSLNSG